MKMKPRTTTKNTRALLYRRFIGLEKSSSLNALYKTTRRDEITGQNITEYWTFDCGTAEFSIVPEDVNIQGATITTINSFPETNSLPPTILHYQGSYFRYNSELGWQKVDDVQSSGIVLLNATFNNIAQYQTNKYYYVKSFDYVIKGSIDGTTAQYIRGNIIPLTTLNIKHFDDSVNLKEDDLVVVNGRLYSVESPSKSYKQQPRNYCVYYATLNSIL